MNTEKISDNPPSEFVHSGIENCLAVGTRLNDFEITGILGEGGFGIVYLAFDHSLQRTVAIKEYMPGALASRAADASVVVRVDRHRKTFDAGLRSFINEARLLAQFDHPSLVKVYRFWEENKTAYMVMRHYDGYTLKDIVRKRPEIVTEAWLKFIFKQILEALDTLYKAKVLHRDVSPDNIIVQKNGDAVLLDFGSARQIIGDMTQGLTVILKPGYAPVEQYSDDDDLQQGPWTDIYALAAVMFFTIMKTPPPISVARIVKETLVPLQNEERPGFSTKFLIAVDKALSIQPQDRPQTVDEFRRLLGISAFGSSRTSRASRSAQVAEVANESVDTDKISGVKSTPYSLAGTTKSRVVEVGADVVTIRVLNSNIQVKSKLIIAAAGTIALLALAAYFSMHHTSEKASQSAEPVLNQPASLVASGPSPLVAADPEKQAWEKLNEESNITPELIAAFLQQYPNGQYAAQAQLRIAELSKPDIEAKAPEAAVQDKVESTFNVKLGIKPWGTVFVDGVQNGATPPLKNIKLSKGKHKIRVTNPGFPDYVTEVDGTKKNTVTIEHEFTGK